MRPSSLLFPLLALFACDDKGQIQLDDSGVDDSAVEGDADTDADSDTDTDTDADGDADVTLLTFDIEGEYDGSAMELTWFLPGDAELVLGDTIVSAEVTSNPFELAAPVPASSDLMELDPTNAPGFYAALYLISLHEDSDGDHVHQDEPYLGVSRVWMFYADGTIPEGYLQIGIRHGWNALVPDLENDVPPTVLSIDAIPIATNLVPVDEITFGGTYTGTPDVSSLRLALIPYVAFEGQNPGSLLYDEAMSAAWSISLQGAPPPQHVVTGGDLNGVALEVPLTYVDVDGSGAFSTGDTGALAACYGGLTAAVWYYPQPTDLTTATYASLFGYGTGWAAFTVDANDQFAFLDETQRTSLVIEDGCGL